MVFIIIVLIILLFYLFAVRGRVGFKGLEKIKGFNYAHRGLHGNGVAENSLTAFALAKEKGYGIELDIHLLRDGNLAVIHDSSLIRTTGQKGEVEELTVSDLKKYKLENTEDTIPTLQEVLKLFDGAAPIIIELKAARGNHSLLAKKACEALKDYTGEYCIESFDPRCILWLKKNQPQIVRGQLSQNFFKTDDKLSFVIKLLLTHNLLNFITKPDFVAYSFSHRKSVLSNLICQRLWKMQMVGWTIRSIAEQKKVIKENWLSIFEYFLP